MNLSYDEIAVNASTIILNCLLQNDEKHGDTWKNHSDGKDVSHIIEHLRKHLQADETEEHLEHSITRLALMLARRRAAI